MRHRTVGGAKAVHRRPHRVDEVALLERIASPVDEKELDGIADLRDESDRDGPKRDVVADAVQNNLPKKTPLCTTSSSGNFLALFGGGTAPRRFTLRAHRCCWRGTPPDPGVF